MKKTLTVPIYDRRLALFDSVQEASDFCEKTTGECLEVGLLDGVAGRANSVYFIAINKDDATPAIVAHEALHCAWMMLEAVGVECTEQNHEALAYLVGWLVDRWNRVMA